MGDSSNVFDKDISNLKVSLINSNSAGSYALNGKIMLCTVVILILSVFLILGLHTYARWYLHSRRRRQRSPDHQLLESGAGAAVYTDALDVKTLKSLSTFTYAADQHLTIDGCAVCLSDFEHGESGRVLPSCGHVFHVECIDIWFWSHSNCPLCRAAVKPVTLGPQGSGDAVVDMEEVTVEPPLSMEERYNDTGIAAETGSGSRECNRAKPQCNQDS